MKKVILLFLLVYCLYPAHLRAGPYTLSGGDGEKKVSVAFRDEIGNVSPVASGSIALDTTPPLEAAPSGPVITSRPPDSSYSASAGISFTDMFGLKASDASENQNDVPAFYPWVAKAPPVNTTPPGFVNKGGSYFTDTRSAKVMISATSAKGVTGYYISESPVAPRPSDPGWVAVGATESFSRSVPVMLSKGTGAKTVHVWFKDAEGNVSEAKSDTVYLFNSSYVALIFVLLQVAALIIFM